MSGFEMKKLKFSLITGFYPFYERCVLGRVRSRLVKSLRSRFERERRMHAFERKRVQIWVKVKLNSAFNVK